MKKEFPVKRRIILSVVTAIAVLALFSYFSSRPNPVQANSNPPEYTDSSRTIETEVGHEFVIVLDSNAGTGYRWSLVGEVDKNVLNIVEIRHNASKSGRLGAGGKDRWVLRGLRAGTVTLSLQYVRPWEKDVPPAKKEDFTVIIKSSK